MESDKIIEVSNVDFVRNGKRILNNVSFDVNRGDFVAITGPNGGGKTSLLRLILKLVKPSKGQINYYSQDGAKTKRLNIGYLPQKSTIDSHFPITAKEVVMSGLLSQSGVSRDEISRKADEILRQVEMEDRANQTIGTLSGGQLQRVLIGRSLINEPELLVMDEPLSYLDKHFESRLYSILQSLSNKCTILLVSHELTTIDRFANRHLIVDRNVEVCAASSHYAPQMTCDPPCPCPDCFDDNPKRTYSPIR